MHDIVIGQKPRRGEKLEDTCTYVEKRTQSVFKIPLGFKLFCMILPIE